MPRAGVPATIVQAIARRPRDEWNVASARGEPRALERAPARRYARSMRLLLPAVLFAAACTAHNPDFVGGAGDLNGAPPADLAGATLDLAGPMGACSAGQRMCAGTVASDRCEAGVFIVDRVCPPMSQCMSNYCAPPPPVPASQVGQRCDAIGGGPQQLACMATSGLSCQPFVVPGTGTLRWYCDTSVGAGSAGTHCTKGSECRSGFCGGNGTCFEACQNAGPTTACTLNCQSVELVVEGVKVTAKSCVP